MESSTREPTTIVYDVEQDACSSCNSAEHPPEVIVLHVDHKTAPIVFCKRCWVILLASAAEHLRTLDQPQF